MGGRSGQGYVFGEEFAEDGGWYTNAAESRRWTRDRLVMIAMFLVVVFCLGGAVGSGLPQETKPESYRVAVVLCEEHGDTPWEISYCKWEAYEDFYGTDVAQVAWENGTGKR